MASNTNLKRVVLVTAGVAVAALGVAALIALATGGFTSLGRADAQVDQRETPSLAGVDQLRVESVSEDIHIKSSSADTLDAWFHGFVRGRDSRSLPRMVLDRSGSIMTVHIERPPFVFGFFWGILSLDVSVPASYTGSLSVSSVSARVDVEDHQYSKLALSTVSGEIQVGSVKSSDFSANTTSGRVRAGSVDSSTAELSSVSGEIEVQSLSGATAVHTTSGRVAITYATMPAAVDAVTTSGSVLLRFPQDSAFDLDARSTSGDVKCAFPITIAESTSGGGRHALAGTVGNGGNKVSVRTVSGGIDVTK